MTASRPRVGGQFIAGARGPLAVVVWQPPPGTPLRFGALHLPAAGDESNKSRRVVATQARAFASRGGTVVLVDPYGTGDSAGDHGDATWAAWRSDAETAWEWLASLVGPLPTILWGLRLGGLLAADLVASGRLAPELLLLWQPVASGRAFFNQWLRIASTQQFIGSDPSTEGSKALRGRLAGGERVEIAGYELNPALVSGAEAIDLADLRAPTCHVAWLETTAAQPPVLSAAGTRISERWLGQSESVQACAVHSPSFWASQELADAPALIAATTEALVACVDGAEHARP